ncbi:Hypothetical protein POVR1_LOCUS575 [uncultured virus]|nr:Hypothetical protein POVR1_LOCUS575 [uncultured virus]
MCQIVKLVGALELLPEMKNLIQNIICQLAVNTIVTEPEAIEDDDSDDDRYYDLSYGPDTSSDDDPWLIHHQAAAEGWNVL